MLLRGLTDFDTEHRLQRASPATPRTSDRTRSEDLQLKSDCSHIIWCPSRWTATQYSSHNDNCSLLYFLPSLSVFVLLSTLGLRGATVG